MDGDDADIDIQAVNGGVILSANGLLRLDTDTPILSLNNTGGASDIDSANSTTLSNLQFTGGDAIITDAFGNTLNSGTFIPVDTGNFNWIITPTVQGDIQVRFVSTRVGFTTGDMAIDDFSIEEAPACAPVALLGTGVLNANDAEILWTSQGSETSWISYRSCSSLKI